MNNEKRCLKKTINIWKLAPQAAFFLWNYAKNPGLFLLLCQQQVVVWPPRPRLLLFHLNFILNPVAHTFVADVGEKAGQLEKLKIGAKLGSNVEKLNPKLRKYTNKVRNISKDEFWTTQIRLGKMSIFKMEYFSAEISEKLHPS